MYPHQSSLTDYINTHLLETLTTQLQRFLNAADPATLPTPLRRMRQKGPLIVVSASAQRAEIWDQPDTAIAFDLRVRATIRLPKKNGVIDTLILSCRADLAHQLRDLTILDIDRHHNPDEMAWRLIQHLSEEHDRLYLTDSLLPDADLDDLEAIATDFLLEYYPEALDQPMRLDPITLAQRMDLRVVCHRIAADRSVYGQIYFRPAQAQLYDPATRRQTSHSVQAGTIIVDPTASFLRNIGTFASTIVHECVHWQLHRKAFLLQALSADAPHATGIHCRVDGSVQDHQNLDTFFMEWQANALAPRIQMPLRPFRQLAQARLARKGVDPTERHNPALCDLMPRLIDELAAHFGVSQTAAKLRLIEIGYEQAASAHLHIDGRTIAPHTWAGSLAPHETFSVPAREAARLRQQDPELATDDYLYIDSHFVLNDPRYITTGPDNLPHMTTYARYHMDQSSLLFDMSLQEPIASRYQREYYLNRTGNAPGQFTFTKSSKNHRYAPPFSIHLDYSQHYLNTQKDQGQKPLSFNHLLVTTLLDVANLHSQLTNDIGTSWRSVLKWRGITQKELARRSKRSSQTLSDIITGRSAGTLETWVAMCLAAQLPWEISEHLLSLSSFHLSLSNKNHILYRHALIYMYDKSPDTIDAFLQLNDVPQLF